MATQHTLRPIEPARDLSIQSQEPAQAEAKKSLAHGAVARQEGTTAAIQLDGRSRGHLEEAGTDKLSAVAAIKHQSALLDIHRAGVLNADIFKCGSARSGALAQGAGVLE